jgi:hypothetical protein
MRHKTRRLALLGSWLSLMGTACGGGGGGTGSCPFTLMVDGSSYNGDTCTAQGGSTFVGGGLYQISLSATFNGPPPPIRSINFILNDHDNPGVETHIKDFPASDAVPGSQANYHPSGLETWSTLSGTTTVGNGSLTVTEYDRTNKRISATYDYMVFKQGMSKHVTGAVTHLSMSRAD